MLHPTAARTAAIKPATLTLASPNQQPGGAVDLLGAQMRFARDAEIYGEGEPADYLYKVISGAVRTHKILKDGRRQIGGFYDAGDVFGLESGAMHAFSAEAITDCKVLVIKRSALTAMAQRDHEVARELWSITGAELQRVQSHMMLLVKSAQERVAAFLLEMVERGSPSNAIELPMSRQDIADYLGLTIETVSRTFTALEKTATIELSPSRRTVLCDRSALSRLNG